MKALKKNDMGVSPVIAVILMVAITVVLAGVVFLWAQSFTDDAEGGVETMNVKGSIQVDGATEGTDYDVFTAEVVSGTIDWTQYKITVDGDIVYTYTAGSVPTANAGDSSAGEEQDFISAALDSSLLVGSEYTVKIVNIADNKVVWEDDIIATA